jgi:hypothetical protein
MNDQLYQLNKLKYERLIVIHHQEVRKKQQKSWHDHHLNKEDIKERDLVLLYDSRIKGKPRKIEITWLEPYVVEYI